MSNSSSWPWPSRAATPRTSPARSSNETSCSRPPTARSRTASRGVVASTAAAGARAGRHLRLGLGDPLAEHEGDDPLLGALVDVHDADRRAFAQDGGPVADGGDLDEPVGDEDDAAVGPALVADDVQDAFGQVGRQRCGHLVEHEDVGLDRERARQVDDPQGREGQVAGDVGQVQVADAQLLQPVAERLDRGPGQAKVRSDVQVRDDRRLLVDGDDAAAPGLGGGPGHDTARRGP